MNGAIYDNFCSIGSTQNQDHKIIQYELKKWTEFYIRRLRLYEPHHWYV